MTLRTLRPLVLLCTLVTPAAFGQAMVCPQFGSDDADTLPEARDDKLVLMADQAELTQEGLSTLAGTVRLIQGANRIEAQALSFDQNSQRVVLSAESLFRSRDLVVRSREAELDLANETGTFRGSEFTLVRRSARGAAERIHLAKAGTVHIEDVYYTTCAPGSRAWFLEASEIELDRNEGLGTAKHARLRFGYVPILYAPWFQFPIDDRRRTGLLFPTLGESDNTGFDARIPLYLNLAPNYDALITPRIMSERGTQVASEGRYLLSNHTGRIAYEHLEEDEQEAIRRSYLTFEHHGLINRRLAAEVRYGEVSDTGYFEDLGERLEAASITHLERSAQLTYTAPAAYTIAARVADYQTVSEAALADPNAQPYQRLPEIRFDALTKKAKLGTRVGMIGQYVNFVRDTPGPEGQRVDVNPYLRFVNDQSAFYVASQLDLRYTRYVVTDAASGEDTEPTRTIPIFSVDGGLRFERLTGGGNLQTLEPRVYYLYVPFRDQSGLPQFDTGEPDFGFVQLFAPNRFSGEDRIADANHAALAFTSRLLDPDDGTQRFTASIGQIFRFQAPRVTLDCTSLVCADPPDSGGTDFIAELDYRLPLGLSLATAGQWSADRKELTRGGAALRWRQDRRRADLVYRYREVLPVTGGSLEQFDLSAGTPIYGPISAIGRWRYSREEERSLEALGGLEFETCCWALRGAWRRYQFGYDETLGAPEYTTGVYVQLELKGLTRIGAGFQSLLPPLD